ncbi:hypothetical protein [Rossellomorea aquimaris]|uniref:Uncharacterized protein n=1 Tax=Rossellomorea aquimaris TaxID=189382 RepID=A0A5D4TMT3_9BACI|nr:hypothetical protein [Rossellomorea aquimaris]TYS77007.1 hypothetical protein FZC80_14270 [Rossellomorea aquimaris]
MKKLTDFAPFQWIAAETEPVDFDKWNGSRVLNFIPNRFSHYCKIMHPFYRNLKIADENLLWSECFPGEDIEVETGERIWFKDLALKYNLQYTKEISSHSIVHLHGGSGPQYLLFPYEGTMDKETLEEIIPLIKSFTSDSCYFQYSLLAATYYNEPHGNGYLFYGDLDGVLNLYESSEHVGSPRYWWNENRDWCLYTDHDLDFSLFGGSKRMLNNLKASDFLEVIEVDRDTRVDYKADVINHPFLKKKGRP